MSTIKSRLFLSDVPQCNAPLCKKQVDNVDQAVFVVARTVTMSFCSPACYSAACELALDRKRADQVIKGKRVDLLTSLGFKTGEGLMEGEIGYEDPSISKSNLGTG